jgi:hypothetical protein
MSDTPITERQQYWLDHIQAADAFDGSIADYARSEGLKPKELYSWKGILARRGLLDRRIRCIKGRFSNHVAAFMILEPSLRRNSARAATLRSHRPMSPAATR